MTVVQNPSGFLNFCDAGYFDEDSGYGTEDSNAEDWYGNDYPDEEEDGTDGRSSKDCESDSKVSFVFEIIIHAQNIHHA